MKKHLRESVRLPKGWKTRVRLAVLEVISLAQYSLAYTRGWAANSPNVRIRLQSERDRLQQEVAQLQEEIRIKDGRALRISPHRRPHFLPVERMAILELRAARHWSLQQTADTFQITAATAASWHSRLLDQGSKALVQFRAPVNKFPDFVRYLVQRMKVLCPHLGKVKLAQILARAGLHLAPTTVGRILKERTPASPATAKLIVSERKVTAKRPNHVWHVDLTVAPIVGGFWTSWLPFALPQSWPFCWWILLVMDHFSRRVQGVALFASKPTSAAVCDCLGRTIRQTAATPKYVICDKGSQFWCA